MVKLLITGYMHSGTTMLMGLLRAHPQVGWIEYEKAYIEYVDKSKDWILMHGSRRVPNMKTHVWGDKLPWGWNAHEVKGTRAIAFTKRWLKMFKKEARVLHILRHPIDVALSGRGDTPRERIMKDIVTSVPAYIDFLNKNTRCATVVYEYLLMTQKSRLTEICKFLKIKSDEKSINKMINNTELKFGKINVDRAFAYRNKNIKDEVDYNSTIRKVKVIL